MSTGSDNAQSVSNTSKQDSRPADSCALKSEPTETHFTSEHRDPKVYYSRGQWRLQLTLPVRVANVPADWKSIHYFDPDDKAKPSDTYNELCRVTHAKAAKYDLHRALPGSEIPSGEPSINGSKPSEDDYRRSLIAIYSLDALGNASWYHVHDTRRKRRDLCVSSNPGGLPLSIASIQPGPGSRGDSSQIGATDKSTALHTNAASTKPFSRDAWAANLEMAFDYRSSGHSPSDGRQLTPKQSSKLQSARERLYQNLVRMIAIRSQSQMPGLTASMPSNPTDVASSEGTETAGATVKRTYKLQPQDDEQVVADK